MKNMYFSTSFYYQLLLLLFFTSCNGQTKIQQQATNITEVAEQIKQVENSLGGRVLINGKGENLLQRMAYYNIKGLSIAVVHNYKVVWAKGYGWADKDKKRPVTTETLFKVGSISKSLNAVGVLKLAQDNRIDLGADINTYLLSWKFPYDSLSKGKKITLSHLLSHTGGLSMEGGFMGYSTQDKIPSIPQILDGKGTTPPVRSILEPGIKFLYSGGGTLISQLIINDVTHQPYEKYMFDNVLKPMRMEHSYYSVEPPSGEQLKKIALGYTYNGFEVEYLYNYFPEQAPLGLWTTPTDLCNYIVETQLAYKGKSSKVLNESTVRLQLTPTVGDMAALGFFIEKRGNEKYFHHDGRHGGFCAEFYGGIEDGNGVAICINSDDNTIFDEILNSVATVYNWKGFYNPVTRNVVNIADSMLKNYTGIYIYENKLASIIKKDDGYYFWSGGIRSNKMYFSDSTTFFTQESNIDKSFIKDASGIIVGYKRKAGATQYPDAIKINNAETLKVPVEQLIELAWHLLENKQVTTALACLKRAVQLSNDQTGINLAMAHCYLFNNEYDNAIDAYKQYLNKDTTPGRMNAEMIKYHFQWFKNYGYDAATMEKVRIELKL